MKILDAKSRAMITAGLIKPIDGILFAGIVVDSVVVFFAWIFSPAFTYKYCLTGVGVACMLLLIWCVLLGYRACVMILEARADINMMPESAARLARMYQPTAVSTGEKPKGRAT